MDKARQGDTVRQKNMYKCRQGKTRTHKMATKGTNANKERHKGRQEMAQRERQTSKGTKAINERIHKGGEVIAQWQAGRQGSATDLGKENGKRWLAIVKSQAIKHPFCG